MTALNRAAQRLGRMAKGRPKTLTAEQREQRRQQLAAVRNEEEAAAWEHLDGLWDEIPLIAIGLRGERWEPEKTSGQVRRAYADGLIAGYIETTNQQRKEMIWGTEKN